MTFCNLPEKMPKASTWHSPRNPKMAYENAPGNLQWIAGGSSVKDKPET